MKNFVSTQTWSASLPDGWTHSADDECITFVGPEDIGALQISSYKKDQLVKDQDLADFAEDHLEAGARPTTVTFGKYTGFRIAFAVDDSFWQQWYLRQDSQMLFVSYNCPIADRTHENREILELLSSLAPQGGA
ncbi:hypothetical protein ACFOLC_15895 [Lysobacter cavernae]|uniref:DUF1795 domain-containing protein n=1 Tax=Lysobacter cavernae TaxID=1685901 RepID=A0ABV7RUY8_9GAMM